MDYYDKVLDGKKIALEHEEALKQKVASLSAKPKIVSILVGDDPASVLYSNIKQKKAAEVGIIFELMRFASNDSFDTVAPKINDLNNDPSVHGIMIQMPLPTGFLRGHSDEELINKIDPQKDVDGLRLDSPYLHATALAVMTILTHENISVKGKKVAVVGATGMVGTPLVKVLNEKGAEVMEINSQTEDLGSFTKEADIVISCVGIKNLIGIEEVKDGAVVIDVGMDIDFEAVFLKASKITPPKGGVGPVTVISLLENVLKSVYGNV